MNRRWCGNMAWVLVAIAGLSMTACQNPNSPDETINYNEALDITVDPDPIVADTFTSGNLSCRQGNNRRTSCALRLAPGVSSTSSC